MKIGYFLIILIILVTNSVHSMVFSDGLEHLDKLLQKSLRYKHHQLNYEESLRRGVRIRKDPAFEPISDDFQIKWNEILYNAEKNLVELLLYESSKVVAKLEIDFNKELLNRHPNDYKEKHIYLSKKHKGHKNELEKQRLKKWNKIEEKPPKDHTNSVKTTDNNANSYSTKSHHQEEQGSGYNDGAMPLKDEDKNTAIKADQMKRFNNITDNCVLRKRKQKTYAEATQSVIVESKIVDISPNVEKVDAESGKRSFDLEAIKKNLLSAEGSKFSKVSNTPPNICVDTSLSHNSSDFVPETTETESVLLSTQDMEVLEILEELENNANANFTGCEHKYNTDDSRMKGYFCSDTVFNLSNKVLTEDEIKVLEKGLDFVPIQRKVNEPELRQDFENFYRRMRIK